MAEYISREAALEAAKKSHLYFDIKPIINSIPAADVRPVVKATWIIKEMQALFPGMDEHPVFMCSECGYQIYDLFDNLKEHHNFCPNCGARMEES